MNIKSQRNIADDPLLTLAEAADYDADFFDPVFDLIREKVGRLDPQNASIHILAHLSRAESDTYDFFVTPTTTRPAYSERAALNIAKIMGAHDGAKCMDEPGEWRVTPEKPDYSHLTEDQLKARKARRELHAERGPVLLDATLAELGLKPEPRHLPFIELTKYIMVHHHERADGSGPRGFFASDIGPILSAVTVIDTADGKRKANSDLTAIFVDMSSRHAALYNQTDVNEYRSFREARAKAHRAATPSVLANGMNS